MLKRIAVLFCMACSTSFAGAQVWIPMPFDGDAFVDATSIKDAGTQHTFSFWVKWTGRHLNQKYKKNGITYSVQRLVVKCKPYVTTMQGDTIYYKKNSVAHTLLTRTYDYAEYPPDSVGQSISELVCKSRE